MRHATLFDVFQSAAGAATQALDIISKEKKYVQDLDLFNASMDLNQRELAIAKARELIYDDNGVNYQNNPDYPKDFQEYAGQQMAQWDKQWGQKYPGRYFTDNLHTIKARGEASLKEAVAKAEVDYAIQRVNTAFTSELNTIDNMTNLSTDERLGLKLELTDRTRGMPGFDYEQNRQLVLAKSLEEKLKFDAEAGMTTEAIRKRYDTLAADTLKGGSAETGEEAGLYAALPKAREAIETAREGAIEAQQAFNFRGLLEMNAAYQDLTNKYEAAVREGDAGGIQRLYTEMTALYQRGSSLKGEALGNRSADYNAENRPAIQMMFTNPPVRGKPSGAQGESARRTNLTNEVNSLARRVLDQYRGNLTDSEGNPQTLTMNQAYFYLDDMVKALDLDMPASEYRAMFDKEFINIVRQETGSNEAARFVGTLLQSPLIEDTPEAQKVTGYKSKTGAQHPTDPRQKAALTALSEEYFNQVLNAIATVGLLPGNRSELNQTVESLRQMYTGGLTKILFDTSIAQGSESTVTDTGNNNALAQWLQAAESTPAAHIPSRVEGGSASSSLIDDTTAAYKQRADNYMRTALEGKGVQIVDTNRDGKYVTVTGSDGTMYRLRSEKRVVPREWGGGQAKRDVLIIEKKTANEWDDFLVTPALTGVQQAGETLRRINEGWNIPQSQESQRQAKERRTQQRNRGINWGGATW